MISENTKYEYLIDVIAKDAIIKKWQIEDLERKLKKAEQHLENK